MKPALNQAFSSRLELRIAEPSDQAWLLTLFADCRPGISSLNLDRQLLELLIKQQKQARDMGYKKSFPTAMEYIIERTGSAVGAIYLTANTQQQSVHIVDIGFSEKNRSKGYGSEVINQLKHLFSEINITVDKLNTRAFHFYCKQLFIEIENNQTHYSMRWQS